MLNHSLPPEDAETTGSLASLCVISPDAIGHQTPAWPWLGTGMAPARGTVRRALSPGFFSDGVLREPQPAQVCGQNGDTSLEVSDSVQKGVLRITAFLKSVFQF